MKLLSFLVLLFVAGVHAAPLKVYLLLGQSNMEGHGVVVQEDKQHTQNGTLFYAVKSYKRPADWPLCDTATAATNRCGCDAKGADFSALVNSSSGDGWNQNPNVWVDYFGKAGDSWGTVRNGPLQPGFGFDGKNTLGPELGIGTELGKQDGRNPPGTKVLLLKVAWGGTSLAVDWRPPSSGGEIGWCYSNTTTHVQEVLKDLTTVYPDYDAKEGFELVGWFWHQGWNDGCTVDMSAEYQKNMANLIRDLNNEFSVITKGAKLFVSIAVQGTSGGWGHQPDRRLEVIEGQYNVSTYPEFEGTVGAVETRGFWRDYAETGNGPINQGYHWNGNAESYLYVGTAAGQAMQGLVAGTWKQPVIDPTNNPS